LKKEFIIQVNRLAKERIPFFFLVDFEKQNPLIIAANEVNHRELMYDINGHRNFTSFHCSDSPEMTVYALENIYIQKVFIKLCITCQRVIVIY
jgi:para-aminobenzoate synthetase component 1